MEHHRDPAERARITDRLLAVLVKHRVPAVGLVIWQNVRGAPGLVLLERWLAAGHELGSHSFSHPNYSAVDSLAYIADVDSARRGLVAFLARHDRKLRFFRFPYLHEGETPEKLRAMRRYLRESSQRNLPVTIDDQDWSFEEDWVAARRAGDAAAQRRIGEAYRSALRIEVEDQERRGDALFHRPLPQILLLHANEVGTAQWDALFTWLEQTGHRFATADEVLADSAFAVPHEFVSSHGPGLWDRLVDERRRTETRVAIAKLLTDQAASWNRGDLAAFCAVYADDAAFVAPTGLTHGRQSVLDRYRKRYPDRAAMGTLSLEIVETRLAAGTEGSLLGDARPSHIHGASVVARWTLAYPDKPPATGMTLLVLRPRASGEWEIVQDASM